MCTRTRFYQRFAAHSAARADLLDAVAELISDESWRGDGARDLASWIAACCQISGRTARELVRDAEALSERPALRDALACGSVSIDQCKALAVLSEPGTDDAVQWLEVVPFWSYPELEHAARRKTARELEASDGGTYFRMEHTRDERFMKGEFRLHPEDGAVVLAAVEARIPQGTFLRHWDRAAATALVELAKDPGSSAAARPILVLSVKDASAVAELSSGGFVSSATAKRLACDARVQVVYSDETGRIVETGSASRDIPPHKRRAVEERDNHACTFPGCEMDHYLECHHIIPFEERGPTEVENLLLTCWTHHKLVHEGGWSLAGDAGPKITWIRPDGTVFEPRVRIVLDTS